MTTTKLSATRVAIVRAAADIAPKLVAAGIGGLSATTLITLASTAGVTLSPGLAALITTIIAAVCGYIKHDTPILTDLDAAKAAVADEPETPGLEILEKALAPQTVTYGPPASE